MDRIQGANGIHYRARFFGVDEIFLARTTYTRADLAATLSHEVGHYFELDHTHQYFDKGKCRQEPVDRNRTWPFFSLCFSKEVGARMCEATGDGLSDTPADPELNANSSCNFNAAGNYTTRRDNWDDAYAAPPTGSPVPSTINIMNYNGDRSCRTNFSRLQIAVMLHSIMRGKSSGNRLQWSSPLGEYDEYEMDNFSEVARPIAFNEVQERNFNMQYLGDNVWGMCDVDWVRFVAPCSGNLNISTFGMSGRLNADTRLTLFGNSFNQLAQNDDISTSNRFSNIVWNFIAGQEYFIRIDNMLPDDNRYYALKIGYNVDITGDNSFCGTSNVYNITNLPVGATVRWEALPQGVVTVNSPDDPQTTLTRSNNGVITLTGRITNACGQFVDVSKTIRVGPPTTTCQEIGSGVCNNMNFLCPSQLAGWKYVTLTGSWDASVTGFRLQANGGGYFNNGLTTQDITGRYFSVYVPSGGNNVTVKAMNSCGVSQNTPYVIIYAPKSYGCGGGYYRVSPNPASDNITIAADGNVAASRKGNAVAPFTEVQIIDKMGSIRKRMVYSRGVRAATISTSGLATDNYVVRIFNGTTWEEHKIIVAK